jgi:hypothetical protein
MQICGSVCEHINISIGKRPKLDYHSPMALAEQGPADAANMYIYTFLFAYTYISFVVGFVFEVLHSAFGSAVLSCLEVYQIG